MELASVQSALRDSKLDGWLFYDHHHRDPIAYRVLGMAPLMCTRRWYYFIPASGEPVKLVHRIEPASLAALPGAERRYSSWKEQREKLQAILTGRRRVAMQYSPFNEIPYIGLVDAGTIELVRSFGIEPVSSADLVQIFEARWSSDALFSHLEAGKVVHDAIRGAFALIRDSVEDGKPVTEYGLQQQILRLLRYRGLTTEEPPIVAVNQHSADPHYQPSESESLPIRANDFVLLDCWGKLDRPGAVYFDVTWTGFVGTEVPGQYAKIFNLVRRARDAAIDLVKDAARSGRRLHGYEVDDAARGLITREGFAEFFIHRTGHSIGESVHGNGANMDNFETRDNRLVIPGTCFSIEPGIYLQDFGVRSEVDIYLDEREARVTGEIQQEIVPLLA